MSPGRQPHAPGPDDLGRVLVWLVVLALLFALWCSAAVPR